MSRAITRADNVLEKECLLDIIKIAQPKACANVTKGPVRSSSPSTYFIMDVFLGLKNHKVFALLGARASACFIDSDLARYSKTSMHY